MPTFNPRTTIDLFRQMVTSHELILNRYEELDAIARLVYEAQATTAAMQTAVEAMGRIEAIWNANSMNKLLADAMAGDTNAIEALAPYGLNPERWIELQAAYYVIMAVMLGNAEPLEGIQIPIKTILYRGGNPPAGWGILPQPVVEEPPVEEPPVEEPPVEEPQP